MASGAFAQRINNSFGTNSGFGNVLFPAGKPVTPGVTGNVAGRQGFRGPQGRGFNGGTSVIYVPYLYPYGGGSYYGYGNGYGYGDAPPQQQQSGVTVVYPPPPTPVIVMGAPGGQPADVPHSMIQDYPPQQQPGADNTGAQADATYYLLAFKDHSIYSAVGYWVDGDTLHYITGGNVHNQVSLSLIDRDLTAQLNKGRGVQINLPPAPSR